MPEDANLMINVFNSLNIDDHAAAEQKTNFRYVIASIIITMGQ